MQTYLKEEREDKEMDGGKIYPEIPKDTEMEKWSNYGGEYPPVYHGKEEDCLSIASDLSTNTVEIKNEVLQAELEKSLRREKEMEQRVVEKEKECQELLDARPLLKHVAKLKKIAKRAIQTASDKEKKDGEQKAEPSKEEDEQEMNVIVEEGKDEEHVIRVCTELNSLQDNIRQMREELNAVGKERAEMTETIKSLKKEIDEANKKREQERQEEERQNAERIEAEREAEKKAAEKKDAKSSKIDETPIDIVITPADDEPKKPNPSDGGLGPLVRSQPDSQKAGPSSMTDDDFIQWFEQGDVTTFVPRSAPKLGPGGRILLDSEYKIKKEQQLKKGDIIEVVIPDLQEARMLDEDTILFKDTSFMKGLNGRFENIYGRTPAENEIVESKKRHMNDLEGQLSVLDQNKLEESLEIIRSGKVDISTDERLEEAKKGWLNSISTESELTIQMSYVINGLLVQKLLREVEQLNEQMESSSEDSDSSTRLMGGPGGLTPSAAQEYQDKIDSLKQEVKAANKIIEGMKKDSQECNLRIAKMEIEKQKSTLVAKSKEEIIKENTKVQKELAETKLKYEAEKQKVKGEQNNRAKAKQKYVDSVVDLSLWMCLSGKSDKYEKLREVFQKARPKSEAIKKKWKADIDKGNKITRQQIDKEVRKMVEDEVDITEISAVIEYMYTRWIKPEESDIRDEISLYADNEMEDDCVEETPRDLKSEVEKDMKDFREKMSSEKKKRNGETVYGIFNDIVAPRRVARQQLGGGMAPIDLKLDMSEMPKWDGGHTSGDGYEPTLRQFVQRVEDVAQVKQWTDEAIVMLIPNLLKGGIHHAFDRWRLTHEVEARSWEDVIEWLEENDKATPSRVICNENLYSLKQEKNESVEDYLNRFYTLSAGYIDGSDNVLQSILTNGMNNYLKAYIVGKNPDSLEKTIGYARTWAATEKIKKGLTSEANETDKKRTEKNSSMTYNQNNKTGVSQSMKDKIAPKASKLAGLRVYTKGLKKENAKGMYCDIHQTDDHDYKTCFYKEYVRKGKDGVYYYKGEKKTEIGDGNGKPRVKEEQNAIKEVMAGMSKMLEKMEAKAKENQQQQNAVQKDLSKVQCYNCSKYGHYANTCRAPKKEKDDDKKKGHNSIKQIMETQNAILKAIGESQNLVRDSQGPNANIKFQVKNGEIFVGTLDSAANRTTMSLKTAKRLGLDIHKYDGPVLWSASGHQLEMAGSADIECWPLEEPGRKIREHIHISKNGTDKTLIGYKFLTNNGFCLLPNQKGLEGWTVATADHITVSKAGRQQFAVQSSNCELQEVLAVMTDFEEDVPMLRDDSIKTDREVIQELAEKTEKMVLRDLPQEGDYVDREEPNDEQLVKELPMDPEADYHKDSMKLFDLNFHNRWMKKFSEPGRELVYGEVKIRLKENHTMKKVPPYKTTPELKEAWKKFEEKALADGRIFVSNAEYCSPGLIIEKADRNPDGTKKYRPLVDLREMNKSVEDVCYPLQDISEIYQSMKGKKVFAKMDLADGFHQIRLHPDSYDLTSFVTPNGMFLYHRIPQGYKNGPAEFQRAIDVTLRKVEKKISGSVRAFIDDIIIGSDSVEKLMEDVEIVLQQLYEDGWKLNPSKCTFGAEKMNFLGYMISADGKSVQKQLKEKLSKKIKQALAQPFLEQKDMKLTVQKLCGLLNYYRQFVPQMQSRIKFATKKLKKDAELQEFSDQEREEFLKLVDEIAEAGTFGFPDQYSPTIIIHDTSGIGCGYIALQGSDEDKWTIVDMDSKTFPERKREVATLDRELSGMLFAMVKLGRLVSLSKATFYTDHQALLGLIRNYDGGLVHGRRAQAIMMLRGTGAAFRYLPGLEMLVADALSRWKDGISIRGAVMSYVMEKDLGVSPQVFSGGGEKVEEITDQINLKSYMMRQSPNTRILPKYLMHGVKKPNDRTPKQLMHGVKKPNDDSNIKYKQLYVKPTYSEVTEFGNLSIPTMAKRVLFPELTIQEYINLQKKEMEQKHNDILPEWVLELLKKHGLPEHTEICNNNGRWLVLVNNQDMNEPEEETTKRIVAFSKDMFAKRKEIQQQKKRQQQEKIKIEKEEHPHMQKTKMEMNGVKKPNDPVYMDGGKVDCVKECLKQAGLPEDTQVVKEGCATTIMINRESSGDEPDVMIRKCKVFYENLRHVQKEIRKRFQDQMNEKAEGLKPPQNEEQPNDEKSKYEMEGVKKPNDPIVLDYEWLKNKAEELGLSDISVAGFGDKLQILVVDEREGKVQENKMKAIKLSTEIRKQLTDEENKRIHRTRIGIEERNSTTWFEPFTRELNKYVSTDAVNQIAEKKQTGKQKKKKSLKNRKIQRMHQAMVRGYFGKQNRKFIKEEIKNNEYVMELIREERKIEVLVQEVCVEIIRGETLLNEFFYEQVIEMIDEVIIDTFEEDFKKKTRVEMLEAITEFFRERQDIHGKFVWNEMQRQLATDKGWAYNPVPLCDEKYKDWTNYLENKLAAMKRAMETHNQCECNWKEHEWKYEAIKAMKDKPRERFGWYRN